MTMLKGGKGAGYAMKLLTLPTTSTKAAISCRLQYSILYILVPCNVIYFV